MKRERERERTRDVFRIRIRISDAIEEKESFGCLRETEILKLLLKKKSPRRIVKNAISRENSKHKKNTEDEELHRRCRMKWKGANVGGRDEARKEGRALVRRWGAGQAFSAPREGARCGQIVRVGVGGDE